MLSSRLRMPVQTANVLVKDIIFQAISEALSACLDFRQAELPLSCYD